MTAENHKEILQKQSFNESLKRLSNLENPIPLNPKEINVSEIKNQLLNSGVRVDLIENNPNLKSSIQKTKFSNLETGRGPAMVAAFGGQEILQKYFDWAQSESINQPVLSKGDELSKSRGLIQFAADTIALSTGDLSIENYCRKTNWRVGKKYQKNTEISIQLNLPTDSKGIQKLKETSSVPKGSTIKAFEFILSLNK